MPAGLRRLPKSGNASPHAQLPACGTPARRIGGLSHAKAGIRPRPTKSLKDPELKEKVQRLRQTDNYTNLYYLARTYILLAAVIGGVSLVLSLPSVGRAVLLVEGAVNRCGHRHDRRTAASADGAGARGVPSPPVSQPLLERTRLRLALHVSRCSAPRITTGSSTWPTTSSSTIRIATRTYRSCGPAGTG